MRAAPASEAAKGDFRLGATSAFVAPELSLQFI